MDYDGEHTCCQREENVPGSVLHAKGIKRLKKKTECSQPQQVATAVMCMAVTVRQHECEERETDPSQTAQPELFWKEQGADMIDKHK